MLRRHPRTAFGSVHVFPGGVVDPADHAPALDARCPGLTDADASALLGMRERRPGLLGGRHPRGFEEAGVLLARARRRRAACASTATRAVQARFDEHRRALHAGERSLLDVLEAEDLVLAVDQVRYFSHWITPEGEPKRFDTRFFLARAPEGQAYAHDDAELIGSEWVRPTDALARHRAGDFAMIGPTIRQPPGHRPLRHLRRAARPPTTLAARRRATEVRHDREPATDHDVPQPQRRSCTAWPAR